MIVTERKPLEEILSALGPKKHIFIVGCGECAATCKTGGEKEALDLKKNLEDAGVVVTGWAIPDAPCIGSQVKLNFAKHKKSLDITDAFIVLSCGLGVQSVLENDRLKRTVLAGCDTLFGSILDMTGLSFLERCSMCGECVLNTTGGLCPVTRCAKGLMNGPCGGSNKRKCEVDNSKDCVWILIYDRLKELGQLENLKKIKPPKSYAKASKPRQMALK